MAVSCSLYIIIYLNLLVAWKCHSGDLSQTMSIPFHNFSAPPENSSQEMALTVNYTSINIFHTWKKNNESDVTYAPAFSLLDEELPIKISSNTINENSLITVPANVTFSDESHKPENNSSTLTNISDSSHNISFTTDFPDVLEDRIADKPNATFEEPKVKLFSLLHSTIPIGTTVHQDTEYSTELLDSGLDREFNSTNKKHCWVTIPNSLNHRVIMTFYLLENMTEEADIPDTFKSILSKVFNDSNCNSIVQTSFIIGKVFTFSWTNLTIPEQCDHQSLIMLHNKMFNGSQVSEHFANLFLPMFKLNNMSIERLGNCIDQSSSVMPPLVIAATCMLSISPCVCLLIIKLFHCNSRSKKSKIKPILKSRQQVVFDTENAQYKPSYMRYISSERFIQNQVDPRGFVVDEAVNL